MKKNATMPGMLPTPWGIRKSMSSPWGCGKFFLNGRQRQNWNKILNKIWKHKNRRHSLNNIARNMYDTANERYLRVLPDKIIKIEMKN
jgi:hypothetical protein